MMKAEQRIECMLKFNDGLRRKTEEIAQLIMWEIGKPWPDALKEVTRTIQ
jgi:glyceraldehyde-3-phosphate dehydrogenase (NADP+)